MVLKKCMPPLYEALGVYLPLITTNCAVLGIALTNVQNSYNLIESFVSGLGTAVGFTIAIVIMVYVSVQRTMMFQKVLRECLSFF